MNLTDQIEDIAHRATAAVTDAARELAVRQDRLRNELAEFRLATDARSRLRADLERDAESADSATPRLMLPADAADGSPHLPSERDPAS